MIATAAGLLWVLVAARLLGLGRSTVYQLMDAGGLADGKNGRTRRIRRADLTCLIDRHTVRG